MAFHAREAGVKASIESTVWRVLRDWGVAVLVACSVVPARAQPLPVEHFTRDPALSNVAVSPSGKRLAVLIYGANGMRRLGVIDLQPIGTPRIVGAFQDADVGSAEWVNDERLVFEAYQPGAEIKEGGAATYAVNHDGSDSR